MSEHEEHAVSPRIRFAVHAGYPGRISAQLPEWRSRRDHRPGSAGGAATSARHLHRRGDCSCLHLHHRSWSQEIAGKVNGLDRHHSQHRLFARSVCELSDTRGRWRVRYGKLGLADTLCHCCDSRCDCPLDCISLPRCMCFRFFFNLYSSTQTDGARPACFTTRSGFKLFRQPLKVLHNYGCEVLYGSLWFLNSQSYENMPRRRCRDGFATIFELIS